MMVRVHWITGAALAALAALTLGGFVVTGPAAEPPASARFRSRG